jgi:hypothetical protein
MAVKSLLRACGAGGFVGAGLASWFAPRMIAWWFEPPVPLGFSCKLPIEYALRRLQIAQLVGFGFGGLVGLLFYRLVVKKRGVSEGQTKLPSSE